MKTFMSASSMFSPPNAVMVFHLPSGETALAGTSWFSIELSDGLVTLSVQEPAKKDGWVIPEEFGLNLLPKDFSPVLSSSFPYLKNNSLLPDLPELLGNFIYGEIPSLAGCPVIFNCRKEQHFEKYNQLIISAVITDVFLHGKKEEFLSEELFLGALRT